MKDIDSKRVLVVEDDFDIADLFKIVLENEWHKVESYTDPLLVLSKFEPHFY